MTISTPERFESGLAEVSQEVTEHLSQTGLRPEAVERILQVLTDQIMSVCVTIYQLTSSSVLCSPRKGEISYEGELFLTLVGY